MADDDLKNMIRQLISEGQQRGGGADLGQAIHELVDAVRTLHGTATSTSGLGKTETDLVNAVNAAALFSSRVPVTTGEEAAARLRPYSVEQLHAHGLAPAAGMSQERDLLLGDLHQQTFKAIRGRIQQGDFPVVGNASADAREIVPKTLAENSERMRSTMERLTDSVKQGVDAGATFRMGMGMMSGGGMGTAFRAQATGMLGDMMAAAPEAAPFIGGGMLAAGTALAWQRQSIDYYRTAHALELGPGMGQQQEVTQGTMGTTVARDLEWKLQTYALGKVDKDEAIQAALAAQQQGVGAPGTGTDVYQTTAAAIDYSRAFGMKAPEMAQMLGQMQTSGNMSLQQASKELEDLYYAADNTGQSVSKVTQSFKDLIAAGAPVHQNMMGLAVAQQVVGPNVDLGKMLGPLASATGVSALRDEAVLHFKDYKSLEYAQTHQDVMLSHVAGYIHQLGISAKDPNAIPLAEASITSALGGHDPFGGLSEEKRDQLVMGMINGTISPKQIEHLLKEKSKPPAKPHAPLRTGAADMPGRERGLPENLGGLWDYTTTWFTQRGGAATIGNVAGEAANVWGMMSDPLGTVESGIGSLLGDLFGEHHPSTPHPKPKPPLSKPGAGGGWNAGTGGWSGLTQVPPEFLSTLHSAMAQELGVAPGPAGLTGTPHAAGVLTAAQNAQVAASLSSALGSPAVRSALGHALGGAGTSGGGAGAGGHEAGAMASTFASELMRTLLPALARNLGEAFDNPQVRTAIAQALVSALRAVSTPHGGAPAGGADLASFETNFAVPKGAIQVAGHKVSHPILQAYAAASKATGVPLPLLLAQTAQESGFQTGAVSADHGYGLAQFTDPNVAMKYLHIQKGEDWHQVALGHGKGGIGRVAEGQAEMMRDLIKQYGTRGGLEAYNSGSPTGAAGYAQGIESQAADIVLSGTLVVKDDTGRTTGAATLDRKNHKLHHKPAKGQRTHGQTAGAHQPSLQGGTVA